MAELRFDPFTERLGNDYFPSSEQAADAKRLVSVLPGIRKSSGSI